MRDEDIKALQYCNLQTLENHDHRFSMFPGLICRCISVTTVPRIVLSNSRAIFRARSLFWSGVPADPFTVTGALIEIMGAEALAWPLGLNDGVRAAPTRRNRAIGTACLTLWQ